MEAWAEGDSAFGTAGGIEGGAEVVVFVPTPQPGSMLAPLVERAVRAHGDRIPGLGASH